MELVPGFRPSLVLGLPDNRTVNPTFRVSGKTAAFAFQTGLLRQEIADPHSSDPAENHISDSYLQ